MASRYPGTFDGIDLHGQVAVGAGAKATDRTACPLLRPVTARKRQTQEAELTVGSQGEFTHAACLRTRRPVGARLVERQCSVGVDNRAAVAFHFDT